MQNAALYGVKQVVSEPKVAYFAVKTCVFSRDKAPFYCTYIVFAA